MILLFIVLILFAILFQQKWQLKPCTGCVFFGSCCICVVDLGDKLVPNLVCNPRYVLIGIYGLFVVYQLIQTMMPKSSEGTCNVC